MAGRRTILMVEDEESITVPLSEALDREGFDTRVAGTVACLAYSGSQLPNAIWWGKPLSVVFKEIVDGVVYGLLTAGAFGWLWPR